MFQHAIDWNVSTGAAWTMKPPAAAVKKEPTRLAVTTAFGDLRSLQRERDLDGKIGVYPVPAHCRVGTDRWRAKGADVDEDRAVEVIGVGQRVDRRAHVRPPDDGHRNHRPRAVRVLGLPEGSGRGARRADAAPDRCRPVPDRAHLALSYRARPFRSNLLSAAVSAIDLALWDIKGKALELPVWELLGGRTATAFACTSSSAEERLTSRLIG